MRALDRGPKTLLAVVVMSALCLPLTTPTASAADTAPSISINSPAAPVPAGAVEVRGTVNAGSTTDITTVLYVVDASGSTLDPGSCGSATTLACELAAVTTLNTGLASAPGRLQSGLEVFSDTAEVASLQTAAEGELAFAPPGFTGGLPEPRLNTVASSVGRVGFSVHIGQFIDKRLDGPGTNYSAAVDRALASLAAAPPGPKWIFFLSDGGRAKSTVPADLAKFAAAPDVRLRSFDVHPTDGACSSLLTAMAAATGESCSPVGNPASLSAQLTGSRPADVLGVTVTVGGQSLAAVFTDAVGSWRANFALGACTYTATATAQLTFGAPVSVKRDITVTAPPAGVAAPAPCAVAPGPGALLATKVHVNRPKSSRFAHPKHVKGVVGRFGATPVPTKALKGATVLLQGRKRVGGTWTTFGKSTVGKGGAYEVSWKRRGGIRDLRVNLVAKGAYASSTALVPAAPISACHAKRSGAARVLTCHTIAKSGTAARLFRSGDLVRHSKVAKGLVTMRVRGSVDGSTLKVYSSLKHPFTLKLHF